MAKKEVLAVLVSLGVGLVGARDSVVPPRPVLSAQEVEIEEVSPPPSEDAAPQGVVDPIEQMLKDRGIAESAFRRFQNYVVSTNRGDPESYLFDGCRFFTDRVDSANFQFWYIKTSCHRLDALDNPPEEILHPVVNIDTSTGKRNRFYWGYEGIPGLLYGVRELTDEDIEAIIRSKS